MRRINFLGYFLFTSILIAFVLPLPIVNIVNGNNNAKNLVTQNTSQNSLSNNQEIDVLNTQAKTMDANFDDSVVTESTASSVRKPVVTAKKNINQILPSKVTTTNYDSFLTITPETDLETDPHFKASDDTGELVVTGYYYTTSVHSTGQTASYSYSLTGFAIKSVKPSFFLKKSATNVFPSAISVSNIEKYMDIKDPSGALIHNDIRFVPKDTDGILTINGNYYETTYRSDNPRTISFSYSLKGFSIDDGNKNYKYIFIGIIAGICGIILLTLFILLLKYLLDKSKGIEVPKAPSSRNVRVNEIPKSRRLEDRHGDNRFVAKPKDSKRRY